MSQLYPLEHEKQFLSALIRSEGALLAECPFIGEGDFSDTNRPIFRTVREYVAQNKTVNRFTLIAALEAQSIKIGNAIEPALYINALVDLNNVNEKAALDIAKQIKRWTVRRKLNVMAREMVKATDRDDGRSSEELVGQTMKVFHDEVNLLGGVVDEPKDLYAHIEEFLASEDSIYATKALKTPYHIYNDMYGYFDPQNVIVVVARMKVGKSTWALSTLQQIAQQPEHREKGFRALILDTEMTLERQMARAVSSMTGVREFHILRKTYKRDPVKVKLVEEAMALIRPLYNCVDHIYVGGKSLEEQLAIARRWKFKHLNDGKKGAIVVDYLKLNSGSDFKSQQSLSLNIGEKMDAFKNLSVELEIPLLMLCQANRENVESKMSGKMKNTSVIAGSDYIAQLGSAFLLEKLSIEDKVMLGLNRPDDATHSLRLLASRGLGPNEENHECLVKYKDQRGKDSYDDNYILFAFKDFKVTEAGTFKQAVERASVVHNVQGEARDEDPLARRVP